MAINPFEGFQYNKSSDIQALEDQKFQQAVTSGDQHAMRAAVMQQATNTLAGGSLAKKRAKKTEKVLKTASEQRQNTGDAYADELDFLEKARAAAIDAGLEDIALQSAQKMAIVREQKLQRDLLLAQEARQVEKDRLEMQETVAKIEKMRRETADIGQTSFGREVVMADQLRAAIESGVFEGAELERAKKNLGYLDAKLLKDSTIVGRTEGDLRSDPVLARSMFKDLADTDALLVNIDDSLAQLESLDPFESTWWASKGADFLGFLEQYAGRKPTESEEAFMQRMRDKKAKPTIIAAKIRHALTGAQMSAFEIVYLEPFLPSPSDSPAVMQQKMRVIKNYFKLDADARLALFNSGLTERFFTSQGMRSTVLENDGVTPTPGGGGHDALADEIARREAAGETG